MGNATTLDEEIEKWTAQQTRASAVSACQRAAIPCGPVNELADLVEDPHLRARGLLEPLQHPSYGPVPGANVAGFPLRFSGFDATYRKSAPALGQDTREVLVETLGIAPERLADLVARGIVKTSS